MFTDATSAVMWRSTARSAHGCSTTAGLHDLSRGYLSLLSEVCQQCSVALTKATRAYNWREVHVLLLQLLSILLLLQQLWLLQWNCFYVSVTACYDGLLQAAYNSSSMHSCALHTVCSIECDNGTQDTVAH
jgi:hypothetical protein